MQESVIFLADGSSKSFSEAPTGLAVAQSIGPKLMKDAVGIVVNDSDTIQDIRLPLETGSKIKIVTVKNQEALSILRHSCTHIMAQALQELWPDVRLATGPATDDGFFYDFESAHRFSEEDFPAIEKKMQEIISRALPIQRSVWSKQEAIKHFSEKGEKFKLEIMEKIPDAQVSVYEQGGWLDLCRGPHVQSTGYVGGFKLTAVSGAFWQADENREQLQRIYGTAFFNQKDLNEHLALIEEAKKRDHRKLGRELGIFTLHPFSPGAPFFAPNGALIYNQFVSYIREKYVKYNYKEVITPQIFSTELFHRSGHMDNYAENMFFTDIEERPFALKPMNCPCHCLLYGTEKYSYRDLPLRIADFGRLHRFEKSGVVHGLTRVRSFCQDDAHIFCTKDQLKDEIIGFVTLLREVYSDLGLEKYTIYLSTRPDKRMGSDEVWDEAEGALKEGLNALGIDYVVNPGDGAFYGPKLDIMVTDALKRSWQLGTLQCDFNLPERFDLTYTGEDNRPHRPVMLHRAILGSLERFIGVYLEHTAGRFPTWLSPLQVKVISINDAVAPKCAEIVSAMKSANIRAELDDSNEKLGYKIRQAQLAQVPYMVVVGEREAATDTLSVRLRNGTKAEGITVKDFISHLRKEIADRSLELMTAPEAV